MQRRRADAKPKDLLALMIPYSLRGRDCMNVDTSSICHEPDPAQPAGGASPAPAQSAPNSQTRLADAVEAMRALLRAVPGRSEVVRLDTTRVAVIVTMETQAIERIASELRQMKSLEAAAQSQGASTSRCAVRLLVVDEDESTRSLLRLILARIPGCEVIEAADGRTAWQMLQEASLVDLCISALTLPELNGIQLLQCIRADTRFRELPFILCTSPLDREGADRAAALHVGFCLSKPLDGNKVLEAVQSLLRRVAAQDARQLEKIQARLGLDGPAYGELLLKLSDDIRATVSATRHALATGGRSGVSIKVQALRGACALLHDDALAMVTAAVASSIDENDVSGALVGLEHVEQEYHRLRTLGERFSRLAPIPSETPKR